MKFYRFFLFILAIQNCFCELVFVLEIFRTGARNNVYDFDKWQNNPNIDEITEVGIHQHYILGLQLREKYINDLNFLSPEFNETEFLIYSTDFNRTITSVNSHMLGLYPNKTELSPFKNEFIPNILNLEASAEVEYILKAAYNTFPIHTFNEKNDILLKALKCQGFNLLILENKENNQILEKLKLDYHEYFLKLSKIMGIEKLNYDKFFRIMDGFSTDIFANRHIPSEIDENLWAKLKFLYALYWPVSYFSKETNTRFANTLIFDYITKVFDMKVEKTSPFSHKKYIVLGGHDINLVHLMIGFNFTSSVCIYERFSKNLTQTDDCDTVYPSFASNILIELHENKTNNEYHVKIAMNGKYMKICGEDKEECSYNEFKKRLSDYQIPNFEELCYSEKEAKKFIFNLDYTKKLLIYIISIIETSVLLILFIIFFRMKIKTEEKEPLKQFFNMGAKQ